MEVVGQIWMFLQEKADAGVSPIILRGGRRAAKTWTTAQFLLNRIFSYGEKVIFASMTQEQGSEGVFDDCRNIIQSNPAWSPYFDIKVSPRQVETRFLRDGKRGTGVFRSFKNSETAKGSACDWIFINEGNNFTKQQYDDLAPNARKGVIIDFNPVHCWIEGEIADGNELHVKWQWNKRHLTATQIAWFEKIAAKALAPTATVADQYLYKVYYLGEYGELKGDIFTPSNIRQEEDIPRDLEYYVFCDPSALCGADHFACALGGTDGKTLYIVDTFSPNTGDRPLITRQLINWCRAYDVKGVYVETNGQNGIDFYNCASNSDLPVLPWYSRDNKFKRIMGNYQNILERVVFKRSERNEAFLEQVYDFGEKCKHDDNIDCINSLYNMASWTGLLEDPSVSSE